MRLALVALVFAALAANADELPPLEIPFDTGVLIVSADEACHRFRIYLAETREQQLRGLMFVRDMAPTTGMLFVYERPGRLSIWMKNTFISLDVVFVRDTGEVSSIFRDAEPQSLRSMRSTETVQYVLELNAGTSARLGINPGSLLFLDAPEFLLP